MLYKYTKGNPLGLKVPKKAEQMHNDFRGAAGEDFHSLKKQMHRKPRLL